MANVVKSSLGPIGLDKMLVDDLGEVTITNDGATILKQLEVEHPAARVLVQLSEMQDKEVGDGTTSVVILAAELLKVLTSRPLWPTHLRSPCWGPAHNHASLLRPLTCYHAQRANELVKNDAISKKRLQNENLKKTKRAIQPELQEN